MKRIISLAAVSIGCAMACVPAMAQDSDTFTVTTGVDYSSGNYGTDVDTRILVVPVSLRYKTENLRLTATVPWLRIDGSSAIIGDGSGGTVIDPNAPRTVRSGMGDLTLGAAYLIPEETLGFGLDLSARIKVPTASRSKALGTGKVDLTLSAELSKTFDAFTPFVNVGYRIPGEPSGYDLHNGVAVSAGSSVSLGKSVIIGSYDYRQAISDLSRDSEELFGAFSTPVADRLTYTLYGTAGLNEGAADYGVGSMIGFRF